MKTILRIVALQLIIIINSSTSCNRYPYEVHYNYIAGYVIGKETCNADESKDYWLIDFTYLQDSPKVGDTIIINGSTYANVLKTNGLADGLKKVGLPVSIDYRIISTGKIITTGCEVASPITYSLKELTILNQGEIR